MSDSFEFVKIVCRHESGVNHVIQLSAIKSNISKNAKAFLVLSYISAYKKLCSLYNGATEACENAAMPELHFVIL